MKFLKDKMVRLYLDLFENLRMDLSLHGDNTCKKELDTICDVLRKEHLKRENKESNNPSKKAALKPVKKKIPRKFAKKC